MLFRSSKNGIDVIEGVTEVVLNKALPDDSESFLNIFIDQDQAVLKNKQLLQRRILGLTSYYRSAQEQLLPNFVETEEDGKKSVFHVEETEMSDFQFKTYEAARVKERKTEKPTKKPQTIEGLYKESTSTYRIFSRLYCNYVMPDRPIPMKDPVKKDEPPKKGDINDILVQAEKIAEKADVDDENEGEVEEQLEQQTHIGQQITKNLFSGASDQKIVLEVSGTGELFASALLLSFVKSIDKSRINAAPLNFWKLAAGAISACLFF